MTEMRHLDHIRSQTIQIYEKHARAWDEHRPRVLFEQRWLDKFIKLLPPNAHVLDAGCGAGEPIAGYLLDNGFRLTGLDASTNMLEIAGSRFPESTWIKMDMREMNLGRQFDGILSWDAFFHLTQEEQRHALSLFANHLGPDGTLLLTIGHESGEVTGTVEGDQVYHSSLAPDEYRSILNDLGFEKIEIELEDESCGFHSILLATRQ